MREEKQTFQSTLSVRTKESASNNDRAESLFAHAKKDSIFFNYIVVDFKLPEMLYIPLQVNRVRQNGVPFRINQTRHFSALHLI